MTPKRWLFPILLMALLQACPTGSTDIETMMGNTGDGAVPARPDAAGDGGDGDEDAGPIEDAGSVEPDSDGCVALGCEEQGIECGMATDGCGGELNCDPSWGEPCNGFDYCGGDPAKGPNACGCKPRTCEDLGATCGSDVRDGCGGLIDSCGTCPTGNLCDASYKCVCSPVADPCGSAGLVCGTVSNGCATVACGAFAGACGPNTGVCSADKKSCACAVTQVTACAGKTGIVTTGNCTFNCGAACGEAQRLAACAGALCGTAINDCGQTVQCGTCASGTKCVLPTFITDSALPVKAGFAGGYCLNQYVANLLGKYAVRAHSFRQAGSTGVDILTRAEAVELVTMTYQRSTGRVTLKDQGCVGSASGTTILFGGVSTPATVRVPNYHDVPAIVVQLPALSGNQWQRLPAVNAYFPGGGEITGYTPAIPADCVGHLGSEITRALPATGWQPGSPFAPVGAQANTYKCKCPLSASELPAPNRKASGAIDCRVVDSDKDGKPGFSVMTTTNLLGSTTTTVYNASVAETFWRGTVREDRHHTATGEDPPATKSSVVGCSAENSPCNPPTVDCACKFKWNHVQFVPLQNNDPMTCDRFFSPGTKTANQNAIELVFGAGFGSCTATAQCPAGTLCHNSVCKPQSTPGVCSGTGQSTCAAGSSCRSGSCWPTNADCSPSGATLGGMCK